MTFDGYRRAGMHDVIYETSPAVWQDGFPVGNGCFGGLVYQPEDTVFEAAVTRLDVWKYERDPGKFHPFDELRRLARTDPDEMNRRLQEEFIEGQSNFGFKPAGRLRLELDQWIMDPRHTLFDKRQRLRLADGEVDGSYELAGKAMRRTTLAVPDEDILVTHLEDTYRCDAMHYMYTQQLELYRLYDPEAQILRRGVTADGVGYIEFGFGGPFHALIAFRVDGVPWREPVAESRSVRITLELDYAKRNNFAYDIYLTTVTSREPGADLLATAEQRLRQAVQTGFAVYCERNRRAWMDFWRRSGVAFADAALEGLWYFSLYQFAASSRGAVAPGLFGLWNAFGAAPWSGDYHGDINMAMTYWPVFALNHPELADPLLATLEVIFPEAQRETRAYYQIDGAKFPLACSPLGQESTPGYYRMMQCSSGFYCDIYRKRYRFHPEREFLHDVFPVLLACSKFYLALCERGATGQLEIGPSWGPEQGPCPAWNVANDLALIRPLWEFFVEAAGVLGCDLPEVAEVRARLAEFPPFPVADGEFLDSATAGKRIAQCHPGYLAILVPGDLVDADSPLAATARKTVHEHLDHTGRVTFAGKRGSACDLTWPWLAAAAIRLRDAEFAETVLRDIALADFVKPNGMFGYLGSGDFASVAEKRRGVEVPGCATHAMLSQGNNFHGRERMMSMLQQASGFLFAVNESMLQSHGGEIKLFPAPLSLFGARQSFHNLRAEGGVIVSAGYAGGAVVWFELRSEYDYAGTLRLFGGAIPDALPLPRVAPGQWRLELRAGEVFRWGTPEPAPEHTPAIRSFGFPHSVYGKSGAYYQ